MIDELKRFLLVVQEGNLTRTAEKIFITQSALTQSIHRLEKDLHTKLFIQKGKQLQLTSDGKAIVIIAERIVQLWNNAHDPKIRETQIPTYTIGMFDNVALKLGKFFQNNMHNNNYHLELTIDSSGKLLTKLQLGTLDAGLCIVNKTSQLPKNLTLLETYSERLIPVASKLFHGKLDTIPFILYNSGSNTRAHINELFMKNSIQPTIYAESTSVTFMRELALLGCGVALLPENFVKQDLIQGVLQEQKMPIQWKREYGLIVQKNFDGKNQFVEDLKKVLKTIEN
jgi:DNA-binding transcriptional LysR family regulator